MIGVGGVASNAAAGLTSARLSRTRPKGPLSEAPRADEMATEGNLDSKYYQAMTPRSLGERLAVAARDRIYRDFLAHCRPLAADKILDVGVSDVINDAANVLERHYPHRANITAAGLGEAREFKAAFPSVGYTRIEANKPLPFADAAFDIAASNAVLEHVGSRANQELFVREMLRVAKRVFISVPNRFFPIEHHTAIPLLHFWKGSFVAACRWLAKDEWADEKNLILMSRERLDSLLPADAEGYVRYTGVPLGPFSSNLFLLASRRAAPATPIDRQ
jgi:SAM-dependent methyltransferase